MNTEVFYLDAFTSFPFKGNPIAVCPVDKSFSEDKMQKIAFELNLSETAFVSITDQKNNFSNESVFSLRWFTPTNEVKLCGHGTLGTSALLFEHFKNNNIEIFFQTLSGKLSVKKHDNWYWMNFPRHEYEIFDLHDELKEALNLDNYQEAVISDQAEHLLINIGENSDLEKIKPNFVKLKNIVLPYVGGVILTKKGNKNYDFISRYFTP